MDTFWKTAGTPRPIDIEQLGRALEFSVKLVDIAEPIQFGIGKSPKTEGMRFLDSRLCSWRQAKRGTCVMIRAGGDTWRRLCVEWVELITVILTAMMGNSLETSTIGRGTFGNGSAMREILQRLATEDRHDQAQDTGPEIPRYR